MTASLASDKPDGPVQSELGLLLREGSHYLLGLVGTVALGFVSFPIFARVLPVADYGVIDLVQKILLIVTSVAKLGLANSALRFYSRWDFSLHSEGAQRYYSTLFFGTAAPGLLMAALFAASARVFAAGGGSPRLAAALMISALLVVPRSLQSMFWAFLRIEERTRTYNVLAIATKAATIAAILVLIRWQSPSAEMYFLGSAAVEIVLVAGLTVALMRRGVLAISGFDPAYFWMMLSFGFPLVFNEISFVLLDAADRALVQRYLGATELGIYAIAYGLASMIQSLLMTPLSLAVMPIYMRLWSAGQRQRTVEFLSSGLDILMLGSAGLVAIVAATAHGLVILAASSKYEAAEHLLPPIFVGLLMFTLTVFLNAGLLIEKKTGQMAGVMAASAVVNVAINLALLPRMGLYGAALATLISYAFCTGLTAVVAFRNLRLRIEARRVAGYCGAAAAAWAGSCRIEGATLVASVLAKAAISAAIYIVAVYLIDSRVRRWAAARVQRLRSATSGRLE